MIKFPLSDNVQSFIEDHYNDDPNQIILKYKSIDGLPVSIVADQLNGRKKSKDKLPSWYLKKNIVYPPSLNLEQSSSEKAAIAKVAILQRELGPNLSGKTLLDLTGGFGVDSYVFSKHFMKIDFVEPDSYLLTIAKHNHQVLGAINIDYHNTSAEAFLTTVAKSSYDVIFIDPSRRIDGDKKVFSLNQCEPNVAALQQNIWGLTRHLLVKVSPLLDIQVGLKELLFVKSVVVTSVHNECKELLFYSERNFRTEPTIEAININGEKTTFSFVLSQERNAEVTYSDPLRYIYEPNASILKSGAFKLVGVAYNIFKLQPNTHLFTSDCLVEGFPGRIFQIESKVKPDPKSLTLYFKDGKANILVRNYPLSVNDIRKKTRLKDGGEKFLIGCSGMHEKFLLVAIKIK